MGASSEQILIIDDDRGIKSLVQNFLHNRKIEIFHTEDGEKGFSLAQKINPTFVILSADIKNGFLICRKFKKDKFLRKVPLILVSNKGASKVFREHRKLPTRADGYLIKPFSEDEFLALLGEVSPEKFSETSSEMSFAEGGDKTIVSVDYLQLPVVNYIEEEMKEMKKVISTLSTEKETLQKRLNSLEVAIKEEIKSGVHSAIEEVSQRKEAREKAEKAALPAVSEAAHGKETLKESAKKPTEKEEAAEQEIARLKQEIESLKKKNSKLRDEIDSRSGIFMRLESGYKETIDSLISEKEDLQNEVASLQKTLAEATKEVAYLKEECKSALIDRERLKQIPMLLEEIEKLKKVERENETLKKLLEEKSGMEGKIASLEADIKKVGKERDDLLERVSVLEKEKETYIKLLGDLKGVVERFKV